MRIFKHKDKIKYKSIAKFKHLWTTSKWLMVASMISLGLFFVITLIGFIVVVSGADSTGSGVPFYITWWNTFGFPTPTQFEIPASICFIAFEILIVLAFAIQLIVIVNIKDKPLTKKVVASWITNFVVFFVNIAVFEIIWTSLAWEKSTGYDLTAYGVISFGTMIGSMIWTLILNIKAKALRRIKIKADNGVLKHNFKWVRTFDTDGFRTKDVKLVDKQWVLTKDLPDDYIISTNLGWNYVKRLKDNKDDGE